MTRPDGGSDQVRFGRSSARMKPTGVVDSEERAREYVVGRPVPGTPYIVRRLLDQGGQAIVYEVENGIGKRFVLKSVRPTTLGKEFAWRLEQEAKILVRLEHPNIVVAHELGMTNEDPPRAFIVMELLKGQNLRTVLDRKRDLDLCSALEIGASIADALAHTHAAGVVHLDVKPGNVFLHVHPNGTHVIKLLDFGFMRCLEPGGSARSLSGTPTYAAPEQLLDEPVSTRTDTYSLGLILYELLSGRRPFPIDDGIMAVVTARLSRPAPPLSRWVLLPPDVEELVMQCIERRPDYRPAKVSDVARALWDAHARAVRRRRAAQPYETQESLVGLVRETRHPRVIEASSPERTAPVLSEKVGSSTPPVASQEVLNEWFRAVLESEVPPPPKNRGSRVVLFGAMGVVMVGIAVAAVLACRPSTRGVAAIPLPVPSPLVASSAAALPTPASAAPTPSSEVVPAREVSVHARPGLPTQDHAGPPGSP